MDDRQIKSIELQIANYEDQRRTLSTNLDKLNRMYTMAAVVFLIGLVLCFTPLIPLGGFLVLVAALSAITQTIKTSGQQKEINRITQRIYDLRHEISVGLGGSSNTSSSSSSSSSPPRIWKE